MHPLSAREIFPAGNYYALLTASLKRDYDSKTGPFLINYETVLEIGIKADPEERNVVS